MNRRTRRVLSIFSGETPTTEQKKPRGRSNFTRAGMSYIAEHGVAPPEPDFSNVKGQTLQEFFGPLYYGNEE